jgi:hypothetical protein
VQKRVDKRKKENFARGGGVRAPVQGRWAINGRSPAAACSLPDCGLAFAAFTFSNFLDF